MADAGLYVGTGIFLFTFALLSLRSIRSYRIDRPTVALFGATLMLGFGVVSPAEALEAINLNVILLLLGMMLLVAGLDVCGFFDLVSRRIVETARTQIHFLALLLVTTALLSALVLNDTIVLLMTPIVVKTCRLMKVNAAPFLIGEALAANIGSVATPVGNPQNAFIAIQSQLSFVAFVAALLPIALLSLAVAFVALWVSFRRDLSVPITGFAEARKAHPVLVQRRGLVLSFIVVGWTVVSFVVSAPAMLPFIALIGGSVVLLALPAVARTTPRSLFGKVDWSILVLFVGLFIVVRGVKTSGLLDILVQKFGGSASAGNVWSLSGVSALLSNLVSNVPAVLLLAPFVAASPTAGRGTLWLTLAASSTLAGNATVLGAAANMIVVQVAIKAGADVSMKQFVKVGLPTSLLTLGIAAALLAL